MNVSNPTPADLDQIQAVQDMLLPALNLKDKWTQEDFEDVFFCHHQWMPEQQDFYVSYEVLRALAFDARTPDDKATMLQQLIGQFDQSLKTQQP